MKLAISKVFSRRFLLSSIAGISVVYTALQAAKSPLVHSCKKKGMSTVKLSSLKLGLFMVDFDNTCNMKDTCELFYKTSQTYQKASKEEQLKLDLKWKGVTEKYMKGYTSIISKSLEKYGNKSSEYYDEHGLLLFLKDIADFNIEATRDVDESQLIAGADRTGLVWASKQVILYPGCLNLLKSILSHVCVVSVNWSKEFIGYSLDNVIPESKIFANCLLGKNGLSNGKVGKDMISSLDKMEIMQSLIKKNEFNGVNIFVGDSVTDLLCLIKADLGVIVGDSRQLLETTSSFGIKVLQLSPSLQNIDVFLADKKSCQNRPTLFKANDWYEIEELVKKLT